MVEMNCKNIIIAHNILVFMLLVLSLIFTIINNVSYPFCLLSVVYVIVSNFCKNNCSLIGKLPGRTIINVVLLTRYCFLPFVLCVDGTLSIYSNNYNYINEAICLMIYELIVVFFVLELSASKFNIKCLFKESLRTDGFRVSKVSFFVALVVLVFIFIHSKGEILNFGLLNKNNVGDDQFENVSSLEVILWEVLSAWLFIAVVSRQKSKYDKDRKRKRVVCSIVVGIVFIAIAFLGQSRISRWYTLISAVAVVFMLCRFYPDRKRKIMTGILIPAVLLLTIVTVFKNGDGTGNGFFSQIKDLLNSTMFDIYFAGPVSVNNAIGMIRSYDMSLISLVYDVLNNFPIINKFIDTTNSSVYLYNLYIGRAFGTGGDQIIPLLGQSAAYFTYVLSPILSVISVLIISFSDRMFYSSSGSMCYVWGFTSAWMGVETILNMTINLSWVYVRIIPMFIIFGLLASKKPNAVKNYSPYIR